MLVQNINRQNTSASVLCTYKASKTSLQQIKTRRYTIICMTKQELEKKVNELRSLKTLKDELENEVKAVEQEIISYMNEKEIDTEFTETAKITYKPQNRTTLDQEKLSEILGEDLKLFEKVLTFNVLRIK